MKNWFNNSKNPGRSAVIWNTIAGCLNAGQAAIILIFISRYCGIVVAGMVTIAYAVANIFLQLGKYGVRNFQVTDVEEQFSYREYYYNRWITTAFAVVIALVYLIYMKIYGGYSSEKILIFFEIIILKLIDGIEDVFVGRFQQIGRLDIGAKVMGVRLAMSTAAIAIVVCLNMGIHMAFAAGIVISIILDFYFVYITRDELQDNKGRFSWKINWLIILKCFPLCIGLALSIYIGNIPKYMIDAYLSEEIQAIFGYIMMPVFVITLLNQFIYQPVVKRLGDMWEEGDKKGFSRSVIRQCLIVLALTIIVVVGGLLIGLPILSFVYNADLNQYKMEFAFLLIGGSLCALAYYFNVPITTMRKQKWIAVGYIIASLFAIFFGELFVHKYAMMGAAYLYVIVNAIMVLFYGIIIASGIKKN